MLTAEQEKQRECIHKTITYIMENRLQGNMVLSFPGNGSVGGKGKFEYFFTLDRSSPKDMERLRSMEKNIANKEAAETLDKISDTL
jgi:hypothetical protein